MCVYDAKDKWKKFIISGIVNESISSSLFVEFESSFYEF